MLSQMAGCPCLWQNCPPLYTPRFLRPPTDRHCGLSMSGFVSRASVNMELPLTLQDVDFFSFIFIYLFIYLFLYLIDFLQRGRERDRELETPMREKHRSAASCTPPTGDVPATQVHALDRNRTWDPSVFRPTLYPLSQTG